MEDYLEDEFDTHAVLEQSNAPASVPAVSGIITTPAFVNKYLLTVLHELDARPELLTSCTSTVSDTEVEAGGGYGALIAPAEQLFEIIEAEQLYFQSRPGDEAGLPRSFSDASPSSPFPLVAQKAFHRLLFDAVCEALEVYRVHWSRNVHEPWFEHKRLLGTVLHTATASTAAIVDEESDADNDEADEAELPRIRTQMRQVGMERGFALVAHETVPSRHDESLDSTRSRIVRKVSQRVSRMLALSARTPTLGQSLAMAAAHVAALTAGAATAPTPNVKLPSVGQSVLDHEMAIVQRVMDGWNATKSSSASATSSVDESRPHSPEPSLLDLSTDSSDEWEQLEPRESIRLVSELADKLLSDLLLSTCSVLKKIHNKRSTSSFQEQMSAQTTKATGGRSNRRSPISLGSLGSLGHA
jgi:hypothetical protein